MSTRTRIYQNVEDLAQFCGCGVATFREYVAGELFKPFYLELVRDCIKPKEKDIQQGYSSHTNLRLGAVSKRLAQGEAGGKKKFSHPRVNKAQWDETDHYAYFLFMAKTMATESNEGLFWNIDPEIGDVDTHVEARLWQILLRCELERKKKQR